MAFVRLLIAGLVCFLLMGFSFRNDSTTAGDQFLSADQAFRPTAQVNPQGQLVVHFAIAPGTYLYRERFTLETITQGVSLGELQLPKGVVQHDPTFEKDMEVFYNQFEAQIGFKATSETHAFVKVNYQGCADAGLCYPPQTLYLRISLNAQGHVLAVSEVTAEQSQSQSITSSAFTQPTVSNETGRLGATLHSGNLLLIIGVFLLAGLLLSFTPCVLPMVPILSAIIVGQSANTQRGKSFALALAYTMGMALVYTALGVMAGLLGEGLAATLQHPWVVGTFSGLLVLLALSMFGAYNLQLPSSWQMKLGQMSGHFGAGRLTSVFLMGGVSALIVSPCVAAPLAGALVYISQTRDAFIGGVALFSLAMGMSVPLLLLGLSAGSMLPRVGAWMTSVKTFFGMLLLAVAWWLLQAVISSGVSLFLLGSWLALGAALLGAFNALEPQANLPKRALKGAGLILALLAALQIVGSFIGANNPLQPLQPLVDRRSDFTSMPFEKTNKLNFQRIASIEELNQALQSAQGKMVMLDFYADWCTACKEMEYKTFSDASVQAKLQGTVLLKADVTANDAQNKALLKHFGLFGPPGILFFDRQGQENKNARVIGFQPPRAFLNSLLAAGI